MGDTEVLIFAVEKVSCLWDIKSEEYHNRDVKDLAWEQVCKEVIADWDNTNATEKLNKCADLKKKWTHIRDYYRKDLQKYKNIPTGSAAKKQKRYVYADMLHFLAPVFDRRSSQGNYETEDLGEQLETQEHSNDSQEVTNGVTNVIESSMTPRMTPSVPTKKTNKDVPSQILTILQKREQKQIVTVPKDEDDDTKFLLSLRGEMNKMNDTQKLDFKIGMLQLVKKVTQCRNVPSSSSSTCDKYNYSSMSRTLFNSPSVSPLPDESQYSHYNSQPIFRQNAPSFTPLSLQSPSGISDHSSSNSRVIVQSVTRLAPLQSTATKYTEQYAEDSTDEPIETYLRLK